MQRVLVAEDDELVAQVVLAALATLEGVEAVAEPDGLRAAGRLRAERFALVITDIDLPGLDGLALLAAAKEDDPARPVMLMTAHGQLDYAIAAVRGRADEFLVKPVDPAGLATKASALLAAAESARPSVLAVGAHPDDVEIGAAGILLAHAAAGDRVTVLTLTGGERGGDAAQRADEALAAAEVLGAELVHRALPDTSVSEGGATIEAIASVVERTAPNVVYTHSLNDNHQDHRSVHRATVVACRGVPNLYAYQSPSTGITFSPGLFVDVTHHIEDKLRALRAFASQHAIRPYLEEDLILATARYWSRFGSGRYVEPLEVLRSSSGPV